MSWLLKGLGATATVLGLGATYPMIADIPRQRRDAIIEDGPNPVTGEFDDISGIDAKIMQWGGIDINDINELSDQRIYKQALREDPRIRDIERLTGKKFVPGVDPERYVQENFADYQRLKRAENVQTKISENEAVTASAYNSPPAIDARARADRLESEANNRFKLQWQQNEDARRERFEMRQDTLRRQNQLDNRALDNDILKLGLLKQEQANKMTMHGRELEAFRQNKREDMMMALATGLSALGASFVM